MGVLNVKMLVLAILFVDALIAIGVFFSKDNIIALSVTLSFLGLTIVAFVFISLYLKTYSGMLSDLKGFYSLHKDKGIESIYDGFHEKPVFSLHRSDTLGIANVRLHLKHRKLGETTGEEEEEMTEWEQQ